MSGFVRWPIPQPAPGAVPGAQIITPPSVAAGADLTLSPAAATATWAGSTPTVQVGIDRSPAAGTATWAGSTPAVNIDASRSPAAGTTTWTGSTPTVQTDLALSPGVAAATWQGSTPAVSTDISRSPAAGTTTWAGSTPTVQTDIDRTPAAGTITWEGSTSSVITGNVLSLSPGPAVIAWQGSTPTLIAADTLTLSPDAAEAIWEGSTPSVVMGEVVTLSPGAASMTWEGSTPALAISSSLSPGAASMAWDGSTPTTGELPPVEPPVEIPGGAAWEEGDVSTEEVRNLTLSPAPARMLWRGLPAQIQIALDPPRIRLPRLRKRLEPKVDLTLAPGGAQVRWEDSLPRVEIENFVAEGEYAAARSQIDRLEARIREIEREREEELVLLGVLSGSR